MRRADAFGNYSRPVLVDEGRDWGGPYRLYAVGECVRCSRQCVEKHGDDGTVSTDWRGVCGGVGAYPVCGQDITDNLEIRIMACAECMGAAESYQHTLSIARELWQQHGCE